MQAKRDNYFQNMCEKGKNIEGGNKVKALLAETGVCSDRGKDPCSQGKKRHVAGRKTKPHKGAASVRIRKLLQSTEANGG